MKNEHSFFDPVKILRDLVHGYINLTEFELKVINTIYFQRLKDIRQLTCQHVYPSARHTRFEHSLGVMELTKNAVRYLNENGFIETINKKQKHSLLIDDSLLFNLSMAALLHDVGHCIFSHMGETLYDYDEVKEDLIYAIKDNIILSEKKLAPELVNKVEFKYEEVEELINYMEKNYKIGAVHEQISCISILYNFLPILLESSEHSIKVDFVFIIRCILGIKYNVNTSQLMEKYKLKNSLIGLINSSIFDMDKLDYIMRDSFFTGIGTPKIDTKRLFKNMYFDKNYNIVFTSKAVPTLQNIIESRDCLYMYVYNHHTVVYTDFIYTYAIERMTDSARTLILINNPKVRTIEKLNEIIYDNLNDKMVFELGLVLKPYLFSVESVIDSNLSDSDFISLINMVNSNDYDDIEIIKTILEHNIEIDCYDNRKVEQLSLRVLYTFKIIKRLRSREFLMPWWKTVYEFTDFMKKNFTDYFIRKELGKYICSGGNYGLSAKLFRSVLGKNVISVFNDYIRDHSERYQNIQELEEGDFFVAHRSTSFLGPETIEKLHIALPNQKNLNNIKNNFYIKPLTAVIPQKNYNAIYDREGFYIYSSKECIDIDLLEKVFVYVATELVKMGEQNILDLFAPSKKYNITLLKHEHDIHKNEAKLQGELYNNFCEIY